jgi:hypothetical protein
VWFKLVPGANVSHNPFILEHVLNTLHESGAPLRFLIYFDGSELQYFIGLDSELADAVSKYFNALGYSVEPFDLSGKLVVEHFLVSTLRLRNSFVYPIFDLEAFSGRRYDSDNIRYISKISSALAGAMCAMDEKCAVLFEGERESSWRTYSVFAKFINKVEVRQRGSYQLVRDVLMNRESSPKGHIVTSYEKKMIASVKEKMSSNLFRLRITIYTLTYEKLFTIVSSLSKERLNAFTIRDIRLTVREPVRGREGGDVQNGSIVNSVGGGDGGVGLEFVDNALRNFEDLVERGKLGKHAFPMLYYLFRRMLKDDVVVINKNELSIVRSSMSVFRSLSFILGVLFVLSLGAFFAPFVQPPVYFIYFVIGSGLSFVVSLVLSFIRKNVVRIPYEKLGIDVLPELDGIKKDGVLILSPRSLGLDDKFVEDRRRKLLLANLIARILEYAERTELLPVHKGLGRRLFGRKKDIVLSTLEIVPYVLIPQEPENYRIKIGPAITRTSEPTIFKSPLREEIPKPNTTSEEKKTSIATKEKKTISENKNDKT